MSCAKTINPKCVISRSEALKLAPDLVRLTECDDNLFDKVNDAQNSVKRGQKCVVAFKNWKQPIKSVYALVKVTSVNSDCFQAIDGPVIRVTDGKMSWRTDGSDFIAPVK
jgi:hypothetical protein